MAKRAVLVGINGYQDQAVQDLQGCLNDVELIAGVLAGYGFAAGDVTRVVDPANTRQDIFDALDRLVDATQPGDVAVIYYSGHGSQTPDENGDEPDAKDETIVPSDSGRGAGWENRDIADDELNSYVVALTDRTDHVTFIFDSCHSGSVDRSLLAPDGAAAAARRAIPPAETARSDSPRLRSETAGRPKGPRSSSGLLPQGRHVLIAGCLDDQTSKETTFDGRRHGALTYFLAQGLGEDGASLQTAFKHASDEVRKAVEEQQPVIEGPLERIQAPAFAG